MGQAKRRYRPLLHVPGDRGRRLHSGNLHRGSLHLHHAPLCARDLARADHGVRLVLRLLLGEDDNAKIVKIVWALAGLAAAGLAFYFLVYIGGVILPVVFLIVALSCVFLLLRVKPVFQASALAVILAAALAVFFVYTGRVIIPHVEEQGAVSQLSTPREPLRQQVRAALQQRAR